MINEFYSSTPFFIKLQGEEAFKNSQTSNTWTKEPQQVCLFCWHYSTSTKVKSYRVQTRTKISLTSGLWRQGGGGCGLARDGRHGDLWARGEERVRCGHAPVTHGLVAAEVGRVTLQVALVG